MMNLLTLPLEIISLIIEILDFDSITKLSGSCRHIRDTILSDVVCRLALKKVMFSAEAIEAHGSHDYARAFRRVGKRRNSIRYAEPFLVAVVALVENFIYTNGILCYTCGPNSLQILDVHGSATMELVVDIPWLLEHAITDSNPKEKYSFRPVHCSYNILSCLYVPDASDDAVVSQLVILRFGGADVEFITSYPITTPHKLFVRNNKDYLIFGTKTQSGWDGFYRWTLHRLDLQTGVVMDTELVLWDFTGSCIGRDVCFEIFDGYFYCLSIKDKRQPEYGKWNSFYYALRFPLSVATKESCELPPKRNLWRRNSAREGQVDQRWNTLQLIRDEGSGKLYIFESRREWLLQNTQSQRNCYKKELSFDIDGEGYGQPASPIIRPNTPTEETSSEEVSDEEAQHLEDWDSELYYETRPPENIHTGDNGTSGTMLLLRECFVRSYNPSAEAFLDLQYESSERIRLRMRPKPDNDGRSAESLRAADAQLPDSEFNTMVTQGGGTHHGINVWPPDRVLRNHPVIVQLENILWPQTGFEKVEWTMDERSLVYAPGGPVPGCQRPLVLISFDPSIHLPGYPKLSFQDADSDGPNELPLRGGSRPTIPVIRAPESSLTLQNTSTTSSAEDVGASVDPSGNQPTNIAPIPLSVGWAERHQALYLRMPKTDASPLGFDLSL